MSPPPEFQREHEDHGPVNSVTDTDMIIAKGREPVLEVSILLRCKPTIAS
jgi:hypothetical protein